MISSCYYSLIDKEKSLDKSYYEEWFGDCMKVNLRSNHYHFNLTTHFLHCLIGTSHLQMYTLVLINHQNQCH